MDPTCSAVHLLQLEQVELGLVAPYFIVGGCVSTLRSPIAARQGIPAAICATLSAGPYLKKLLDTGEAAEKRAKKERIRQNPEKVGQLVGPSAILSVLSHVVVIRESAVLGSLPLAPGALLAVSTAMSPS